MTSSPATILLLEKSFPSLGGILEVCEMFYSALKDECERGNEELAELTEETARGNKAHV